MDALHVRIALAGVLLLPHTLHRWAEQFQNSDSGIAAGLTAFIAVLATALLTAAVLETVFAAGRRRKIMPGWFLSAWLFALVVPVGAEWWHAAFSIGLGTLVGRLLFGGPGKQIVSPALLALIFLYTAYPGAFGVSVPAVTSPLACLAAAIYLSFTGVVSWRTLTGGLAGLVVTSAVMVWSGVTAEPFLSAGFRHAVTGGFAFGLVFLAADPGNAPLTTGGRWFLGLMTGALIVLVRTLDPAQPDGALHAILLAALLAPLADEWFVHRATLVRRRREEAWP